MYVLVVLDDFSRYSETRCLTTKSEAPEAVLEVLRSWERQHNRKVKAIRTDGGKEFKSDLDAEVKRSGMDHQLTVPYCPQQNGRAERLNRTLMEKTRSMLLHAHMPKVFWAEALQTANFLRNATYMAQLKDTPEFLFTGKRTDSDRIKVFGCMAYSQIPKEKRKKLDAVSEPGIFAGYDRNSKAWRILTFHDGEWMYHVSRDVRFLEDKRGYQELRKLGVCDDEDEVEIELPNIIPAVHGPRDTTYVVSNPIFGDEGSSVSDGFQSAGEDTGSAAPYATASTAGQPEEQQDDHDSEYDEPQESEEDSAEELPPPQDLRRSGRERKPPTDAYARFLPGRLMAIDYTPYANLTDDPQTLEEVRARPDAELWERSVNDELASLLSKEVYEVTELPKGIKALPVRWVFKVKRNEKGQVDKYKTRLVAKGFLQKFGENYIDVFAPTSNLTTVRLMLAYAAMHKLDVQQIDVKTAFLNGELNEEVYIKCPPGFEEDGKVWKLKKAIYGLKQAALAWYDKLNKSLIGLGFVVSDGDPCLYVRDRAGDRVYLIVHVDDCILIGTKPALAKVKSSIKNLFEVSDIGSIKYFLGIELVRDEAAGRLWIGQRQYAQDILNRFGMTDCKTKVVKYSVSQSHAVRSTRTSTEYYRLL